MKGEEGVKNVPKTVHMVYGWPQGEKPFYEKDNSVMYKAGLVKDGYTFV